MRNSVGAKPEGPLTRSAMPAPVPGNLNPLEWNSPSSIGFQTRI